jgi:hypothetical protein
MKLVVEDDLVVDVTPRLDAMTEAIVGKVIPQGQRDGENLLHNSLSREA